MFNKEIVQLIEHNKYSQITTILCYTLLFIVIYEETWQRALYNVFLIIYFTGGVVQIKFLRYKRQWLLAKL